MPELPEVETVCRGLEKTITGKTVLDIETRRAGLRKPFPRHLAKTLSGATVVGLRRRAKYIILDFDNGHSLVIHLGMSGRILIRPRGDNAPHEKHDHLVIVFKNDVQIIMNDPRRFGIVDLVPTAQLEQHALFAHLGAEPLSRHFSPRYLHDILHVKQTNIKTAIMDQRVVVGVGNIYASESLFLSHIAPDRPSDSLSPADTAKLVSAIRVVLKKAIAAGGSSLRDYVQTDGALGYFQHKFKVYARADAPCSRCRTPIRKTVIAGRSTFYCPRCQK